MTSRTRNLLISGAVSAVIAGIGGPALASAGAAATTPMQAADSALQPAAVEDFGYPGAANVLEDKGIKLIKGDGRIMLADCSDAAPQIKVMTVEDPDSGRDGTYCFEASAKTGYLTLELPRVFYLVTADHPISADLTAGDKTETVKLGKDDYESVGEGAAGGVHSVLVEIRVTG